MNLRKKVKNKKGFTLIELIIVIVIIAILAAIAIPALMNYIGKAKQSQVEGEAATVKSAVAAAYAASSAGIISGTYEQAVNEHLGDNFSPAAITTAPNGTVQAKKSEVTYGFTVSNGGVTVTNSAF